MKVLVTVRRGDGEGEIIGNFVYPELYEAGRVNVSGRHYRVVGSDTDGPRQQTLYVMPLRDS